MVTHTYQTRIHYSSVVPRARQDMALDKDVALVYFVKNKVYQHTVKHRSYADVVKSHTHTPATIETNTVKHRDQKVVNVH